MFRHWLPHVCFFLLGILLTSLAPPAMPSRPTTHAACQGHRCACSVGDIPLTECCCAPAAAPAAPDSLSPLEAVRWQLAWGGQAACPARPSLEPLSAAPLLGTSGCDGPDPQGVLDHVLPTPLTLGPLPAAIASANLARPSRWARATLGAPSHSPRPIETVPIA